MKTFVCTLLIIGSMFFAWAGTNHTRTSYYCEKCGMRAGRDQRQWFNVPIRNSFRTFDTEYSKIYRQVVAPTCQHKWIFTNSRSTGNLLHGGENGCGSFPYALRFDGYYPRLKSLSSVKAATVLKSLPLRDPAVDWEHQREIMGALDELDIGSQAEEKQWWDKYKHLFAPKKKQLKAG